MEFLNDDLDLLDVVENGIPRRMYNRKNHFEEMDNLNFCRRFRITKETAAGVVLPQIEEHLEFDEDPNNSVSPLNQLLTTPRFYATDGHLSSIADFMGIHTSTASKIIKRTSEALSGLRPQYIRMPHNEEILQVQNKFFQIGSFPRVIGCIDGTHIRIQSPGGADGEIYRNRKGYFSINVQMVGDSDLKVRDIVSRWPGSQHDNIIFQHSRIKSRLENGEFENCILLGDSAYALKNYLLTPIPNPAGQGEVLYNEAHIRTRNSIERLFGVIKRRFPVLAYGLRLKVQTSLTVIVAAAVLHNFAQDMHEDEPSAQINNDELNYLIAMGDIPEQPVLADNHAVIFRNEIVNYFQNMA